MILLKKPPMNLKIQALLNEIINDSSTEEIEKEKAQSIPSQVCFPAPPPDVVFWKEPHQALDLNLQVENLSKKSQPRTKHSIIGSSNDKDGFHEQSSGEDMDNEGDSDADEQSTEDMEAKNDEVNNEIVVPGTDEGLRDRFNQLFVEFTREKKHEHGHDYWMRC